MMTINSQSGEVTRNGIYWAMAHFSRVVRRGARRIASDGEIAGLSHVAFVNPDGGHCAVLTNSGAARNVTVQLGTGSVRIALDSDSVTTLTWGV
jgi:glucosylceramidase